jgi:hypothetical protein
MCPSACAGSLPLTVSMLILLGQRGAIFVCSAAFTQPVDHYVANMSSCRDSRNESRKYDSSAVWSAAKRHDRDPSMQSSFTRISASFFFFFFSYSTEGSPEQNQQCG